MDLHEILARWSSVLWPMIANHLWQVTLFSAAALLAAVSLRQGPARARYVIWLLASAKFALPSMLLLGIVKAMGIDLSGIVGPVSDDALAVPVFYQVMEPIGSAIEASGNNREAGILHNEIYCALTIIWVIGFLLVLGVWIKKQRRFSQALEAGKLILTGREWDCLLRVRGWIGIKREISLVVSPEIFEPGVWRTRRPVVVLPQNISEHLTDAELEAVMMHEMVHIARWDNLASNLQMLLCSLFWFHPLVWLLDRKLLADRERACDERVIELSGASGVYAASLLKVLRFCLGLNTAGVSSAAGSNLKRRIEQIMATSVDKDSARTHRAQAGATVIAVIALLVATGLLSRASVIAQQDNVVRQRPSAPVGGVQGGVPGGVMGGVPGGVMGGVPGGVLGEVAGGVPGGVMVGVPGGVMGGVPGGVMGGVPGGLDPEQEKTFMEQIERTPAISIKINNPDDAPVTITDASVKALKLESGASPDDDTYMIFPYITVVNKTNQKIKGIAWTLSIGDSHVRVFTEYVNLSLEPYGQIVLGEAKGTRRPFYRPVKGDPATMTAKPFGVYFENGERWGKIPPPPPPPPPPDGEAPSVVAPVGPTPDVVPPTPPAGEPPFPPQIVRNPGGGLQDKATRRVMPAYPEIARAARVSGSVVVEVNIDEDGNVISARAISGHPLLKDAAVDAARQWQFEPTKVDGVPVKVIGTLSFNFVP
jgi:TonB family protein